MSKLTFYKFHPETGQCADYLSDAEMRSLPSFYIILFERMIRLGRRFYWRQNGVEFVRIPLVQIYGIRGLTIEFVNSKVQAS